MNVRLRLYGVFKSAANASEYELELGSQEPTVRTVIQTLVLQARFQKLKELLMDDGNTDPRPNALILVSGRELNTLDGLDTVLNEKDEVALLPIAHGG